MGLGYGFDMFYIGEGGAKRIAPRRRCIYQGSELHTKIQNYHQIPLVKRVFQPDCQGK
jgi:hypothetical protein